MFEVAGAVLKSGETRVPIPDSVEVRHEPRPAVEDPTLGIPVEIDATGTPAHRLVTIGDSLTHGFMSAAIFRTDRSWPRLVAHELGPGTTFRYPVYEPENGPGGLPFDLERLARGFQQRFGHRLDWDEVVPAALWLRRHMDDIEDFWERDPTAFVPTTTDPYHNLAVYGWDLLDAQMLTAERVSAEIEQPNDALLEQMVQNDGARAALVVLDSCRHATDGGTVLDAARRLGGEGSGPAGIETLVVMLGANNALGSVVKLRLAWTPDDYLDTGPDARLESKRASTVWQPPHFDAEWQTLVRELRKIPARHVVVATIPQVTIAPIARGVRSKVRARSRYFPYYTRPWIFDGEFEPDRDPCLTETEARAIDSAIDAYNETIIESVRAARADGLDWYLFDLGGLLDRLAARRYLADPSARPDWWTPYELPPELAALLPTPDTRFFAAGPNGRTQGGIFSLDGVHPTTSGYALVAHEIVKLMDTVMDVPFSDDTRARRPRGSVGVDFSRALDLDTLNGQPPTCLASTLSLLGWADQAVDWIARALP